MRPFIGKERDADEFGDYSHPGDTYGLYGRPSDFDFSYPIRQRVGFVRYDGEYGSNKEHVREGRVRGRNRG
ncbi:hypothetical protein ACFPVX_18835 [Cohnella faecalis]|uniref:Uncharacterized protein n=1 Tax=Cohnella faecalis TaxID=2315694 RepID=A0A398CIX0_9BACL|nr:hypothetical protein [Cohnella faecalis]RIE01149.1 hypothetical protein D3H35_22340 [Cohnella faecalis]